MKYAHSSSIPNDQVLLATLTTIVQNASYRNTSIQQISGPYSPDWDSLISYGVPDWMLDAKFGIYAHWGLYAVPAFGNEWYGKHLYDPNNPIHAEHVRRYGPLNQFGYKDFIPLFMAENYDADAWADLMAASGARYGGFSLAHHDGYGLWDSAVYRWHVGKMGPKTAISTVRW